MIIGQIDNEPVELITNDSGDPHQPMLQWKFGQEVVKSPAEAMSRIVRAAGESGLPACRMIAPSAVRDVRKALVDHQRQSALKALDERIRVMEADGCPPEMLRAERAERDRAAELLAGF